MLRACILTICLVVAGYALAQPYIPDDGSQVVIMVEQSEQLQALKSMRQQLQRQPGNLELLEKIVDRYIGIGRQQADERYFAYAQTLLEPYLDAIRHQSGLLLKWADILQRQHHFDAALMVLDELLRTPAADPRAYLMRAIIYQVKGRYAAAMSDCKALLGRVDMLLSTTCIAQIHGLQGDLSASVSLLQSSVERNDDTDSETLQWSRTVLAEMLIRTGRPRQALVYLQQVINAQEDHYALAIMADVLLQQRRYDEVIQILHGYRHINKLLLRYMIALKKTGASQLHDLGALQTAMQNILLSADSAHYRMLARYLLDVGNDARAAARFARANWQQQREPDDALLLLRCLLAVGDHTGVQALIATIKRIGLRDDRITSMLMGESV